MRRAHTLTWEYTPVRPPKLSARKVEYSRKDVMSPTVSTPEATCSFKASDATAKKGVCTPESGVPIVSRTRTTGKRRSVQRTSRASEGARDRVMAKNSVLTAALEVQKCTRPKGVAVMQKMTLFLHILGKARQTSLVLPHS